LFISNVFAQGLRNAVGKFATAFDLSVTDLRTFGCGSDATGVTVQVGQTVSEGLANTNTARFTDCTIERGYGRTVTVENAANVSFTNCKLHGRRIPDANAADSKELLYVLNSPLCRVLGGEFSECRLSGFTSGAVTVTGTGKSTLIITGTSFDNIGSDDTYSVYFDSTGSESRLSVDDCFFNDVATVSYYFGIAAGVAQNLDYVRIGKSNTYLSNDRIIADLARVDNDVRFIRKAADQTVNNSTTLVNDTELVFTVYPNKTYVAEFDVFYNSSAVSDIKLSAFAPAGSTGRFSFGGPRYLDTGTVGGTGLSDINTTLPVGGLGSIAATRLVASFNVGTTGGTAGISWAQNTAEVSDTSVLAGSSVRIFAK